MKKERIIAFLVLILFILIATRNLILAPGTVGHNWDWLIPPRVDYLQKLLSSSFFTWQDSNLGESRIFQLPSLPFMIFILSPSVLGFGGEFISKFLIILTIILSGSGMFLLLENILTKELPVKKTLLASFIAGFFYAFSPFLFADLIGGAATQFFAYALFPWLLFFVRLLNQNKRFWLYFLLTTLTLSLITISLQVLVLSSLVLAGYFLVQENKIRYLKNIFLVYSAYIFFNLYWILPTAREYFDLSKTVFSSGFFEITHIKTNVPALWEIFVATGYWRPIFLYAIRPSLINYWLFISFLVVFSIFLANLVIKKNKESLFWILLLLISFIFATGGKEPMGDQILWLYLHFPPMALFRSPQHLLPVTILAFAVLLGLTSAILKLEEKRYLAFFFFLAVVFWLHPFFLYGDVGAKYLASEKKDHLDIFRLSPGYQRAFDFFQAESQKNDFKILFLPMSSSPKYLKNNYQNEAQGGDPLVIYSPYGSLVSDINYNLTNKTLAELLEKNIYEREDSLILDEILNLLNIRFVILRNDVVPEFSENKEIWSPKKISQYLENNKNLKKVFTFDDLEVFENLTFQSNNQIFLTSGAIYSNNNPATLLDGISLNSFNSQKGILISNYGQQQVNGWVLERENIFQELLFNNPTRKIVNQNYFNFSLPVYGNYELLVKKEEYSGNFQQDPLVPLNFKLDGLLMIKRPIGEESGWLSYGEFKFETGDHTLEIILPEIVSLIRDASFEESTWLNKSEASLTSERIDGQKALQLLTSNQSISVSQEIKNIKPQALYKISFWAKTAQGSPPHVSIFQDTDVIREGKIIPKVNHYLAKDASYHLFETKLNTNIDTQKATLYFYADPSINENQTVVLYDDVRVERLFDSPVFLRQKDQKTLKESLIPKLNYRRINETKYLVEIQGAEVPYFLTFGESFNPQWKIFPLRENENPNLDLLARNWFRQSMPETDHYLANYYANAWYIEKKGNYNLIIEYRPQRLFYLGGLVSLSFLLLLCGIAVFKK